MKMIYLYDKNTGEYLDSDCQYLDPMETKKQKKKVYIKVPDSTFKKPLKAKQYTANVFEAGEWKLIPDFRGVDLFAKDSAELIRVELGDIPKNTLTIKSPTLFTKPIWDSELDEWKEEATSEEIITDLKDRLDQKAKDEAVEP